MIGNFLRHVFHLVVYIVIFFGLVWLLLDIPPQEAYLTSVKNLSNLSSRFGSFSNRTLSEMKESAETQAGRTSDRFHGKDPYKKVAERVDMTVHQANPHPQRGVDQGSD